jgi:hypothetical protein
MAPAKFIGMLFQSRDMMHLTHLDTRSFAEHKALDFYYSGILDLTDSFTEKYFGRNGRVEIVIPEAKKQDAVTHLKELRAVIEAERDNYSTDLQNIMDDMIGHVNETLYLLTLV